MVTVDLSKTYEAINPAFWWLIDDATRIQVMVGGAASSKSYSTAQSKIYKALAEPGHRTLVTRKVGKTIRHSCFDLLLGVIDAWGMGDLFTSNKTDMMINCKLNRNQIIFAGLDDVEKLKSIYGVTDIWCEEASEMTEADFNQLNLRLRGETRWPKQITLTLNPIHNTHWIKARFFDKQEPNCITHRSTYLDNTFLDAASKRMLEGITDRYYRDVYVLGNWGTYGNIVFTNYVIHEFDYGANDLEAVSNGLDFGYIHAQCLIRCGFRDGEIFVFDELWLKNRTNAQFIEDAKEWFGDDLAGMDIVADSANPDKIQEWQDNGFKVRKAKKGQGSLRFGIEYLVGKRIHIHTTKCPNLAREIQTFKRREDKDGNALEDYVEINDDAIAALRYATEWRWAGQEVFEDSDITLAIRRGEKLRPLELVEAIDG